MVHRWHHDQSADAAEPRQAEDEAAEAAWLAQLVAAPLAEPQLLRELLLAADYLQMEALVWALNAAVGAAVDAMSVAEIYNKYGADTEPVPEPEPEPAPKPEPQPQPKPEPQPVKLLLPTSPIKELRAFVQFHALGIKGSKKSELYADIAQAMRGKGAGDGPYELQTLAAPAKAKKKARWDGVITNSQQVHELIINILLRHRGAASAADICDDLRTVWTSLREVLEADFAAERCGKYETCAQGCGKYGCGKYETGDFKPSMVERALGALTPSGEPVYTRELRGTEYVYHARTDMYALLGRRGLGDKDIAAKLEEALTTSKQFMQLVDREEWPQPAAAAVAECAPSASRRRAFVRSSTCAGLPETAIEGIVGELGVATLLELADGLETYPATGAEVSAALALAPPVGTAANPAPAVAALPAIEDYWSEVEDRDDERCSLMFKVLKQVHPDTEISAEASRVINRYLQDILLAVTSQSATQAKLDATLSLLAPNSDLHSRTVNQEDVDQMTAGGSLSAKGIQAAVRVHLTGELAKHAVSEGTKAVTKYTSNIGQVGANRPAARCAGLQFEVEKLERCCAILGRPISREAAVYGSAVLEYMSAEILELSGNAALDQQHEVIQPLDVALAVDNDEELSATGKHIASARGDSGPPSLLDDAHGSLYSPKQDPAAVCAVIGAFGASAFSAKTVIGKQPAGFAIERGSAASVVALLARADGVNVSKLALHTLQLKCKGSGIEAREGLRAVDADTVAAALATVPLPHMLAQADRFTDAEIVAAVNGAEAAEIQSVAYPSLSLLSDAKTWPGGKKMPDSKLWYGLATPGIRKFAKDHPCRVILATQPAEVSRTGLAGRGGAPGEEHEKVPGGQVLNCTSYRHSTPSGTAVDLVEVEWVVNEDRSRYTPNALRSKANIKCEKLALACENASMLHLAIAYGCSQAVLSAVLGQEALGGRKQLQVVDDAGKAALVLAVELRAAPSTLALLLAGTPRAGGDAAVADPARVDRHTIVACTWPLVLQLANEALSAAVENAQWTLQSSELAADGHFGQRYAAEVLALLAPYVPPPMFTCEQDCGFESREEGVVEAHEQGCEHAATAKQAAAAAAASWPATTLTGTPCKSCKKKGSGFFCSRHAAPVLAVVSSFEFSPEHVREGESEAAALDAEDAAQSKATAEALEAAASKPVAGGTCAACGWLAADCICETCAAPCAKKAPDAKKK